MMVLILLILAFLAPDMARAVAFSSAIPRPTQSTPTMDGWSPAPTAPPQLPFGLSRREQSGSNTCGFASGASESAITCPNPTETCATNTYYGVHGCCNPSSNTACTIATTCIASTAMSVSCTDASCTTNSAIAKCTDASAPACYEWRFIYDRMVFTQHGCAPTPFTSTAFHSLGMTLSSSTIDDVTFTAAATQEPLIKPPSPSSTTSPTSKPSIGIIVGSTIGACLFASFIAFVVFLACRRRRTVRRNALQSRSYQQTNQTLVEYNPLGFPSPVFSSPASPYRDDFKGWQQQQQQATQGTTEVLVYPGMGRARLGVVEVEAWERPVEAPGAEK